jgi:hypothetical protein
MKQDSRKKLQIVLLGAVLMVVGMSVAFAALSTALNIGTNTVNSLGGTGISWNIHFNGTSISATVGGTNSTVGRSCGTATVSSDQLTVSVGTTTLSKPDDSCTYALVIKNDGTIPGMLNGITVTKPTSTTCTTSGASMVCGNITYKLTTDAAGNTLLTTGGSALAASGSRTIYLVVKYTGTTLSSSAVTQSNGKFTLQYDQY